MPASARFSSIKPNSKLEDLVKGSLTVLPLDNWSNMWETHGLTLL